MVSAVAPSATVFANTVPEQVRNDKGVMPGTGSKAFIPAGKALDVKEVGMPNPLPRPPARPDDKETDPKVWQQYYTDYLAYIAKLADPKQKQAAWLALAKDLLRLSKENPNMITAATMNKVLNSLANEYKEMWKNSDYKLDLAAASANIVRAALNFVKSDAFWSMDSETQKNIIRSFTNLAVEVSWRKSFANFKELMTGNPGMHAEIGEFFKTLLEKGSTDMKAFAFNKLMGLFDTVAWDNPDVAKGFLTTALKDIPGGLGGLIQTFMDNLDNSSLSGDTRGLIACALARIFTHSNVLTETTGFQNINKGEIIQRLDAFLGQVNSGSVTLSEGMRNSLVHYVGCAVGQIISQGAQEKDMNQQLISSFTKFAEDSLFLSDEDGGSASLRATAINILKSLMDKADAKDDTALVDKFKGILLDDRLNSAQFIDAARELMGTTKNADLAAWVARALATIALVNLQNNTGNVNITAVKDIISDIAGWIGNKDNLLNMRVMSYQQALFEAVGALAAQIYQEGSGLGADQEIADGMVAIFSQINGLQDAQVKTAAMNAVANLITSLQQNGYSDLADKLSEIITPKVTGGGNA